MSSSDAVSEFSTRERWAIVHEKRMTMDIKKRHRRILTDNIYRNLTFNEFPFSAIWPLPSFCIPD